MDLSDLEAATEQIEELGRILEAESGDLEAASTNIENYVTEECGISLE